MEPTEPASKPIVDPLNTLAWFLMDAFWLLKLEWPAYGFAAITVVTGVVLLVLDRRESWGALLADLGLFCWIVMNTVWMVSDLNDGEPPRVFSIVVAVLGAGFIVAAAWSSEDVRRLRVFQRGRRRKWRRPGGTT